MSNQNPPPSITHIQSFPPFQPPSPSTFQPLGISTSSSNQEAIGVPQQPQPPPFSVISTSSPQLPTQVTYSLPFPQPPNPPPVALPPPSSPPSLSFQTATFRNKQGKSALLECCQFLKVPLPQFARIPVVSPLGFKASVHIVAPIDKTFHSVETMSTVKGAEHHVANVALAYLLSISGEAQSVAVLHEEGKSALVILTEICQKNQWTVPAYDIKFVGGSMDKPLFSGTVTIPEAQIECTTTEPLSSKKQAKLRAAEIGLYALISKQSSSSQQSTQQREALPQVKNQQQSQPLPQAKNQQQSQPLPQAKNQQQSQPPQNNNQQSQRSHSRGRESHYHHTQFPPLQPQFVQQPQFAQQQPQFVQQQPQFAQQQPQFAQQQPQFVQQQQPYQYPQPPLQYIQPQWQYPAPYLMPPQPPQLQQVPFMPQQYPMFQLVPPQQPILLQQVPVQQQQQPQQQQQQLQQQ